MDLLDNLGVHFDLFNQLSAVIIFDGFLGLRWMRRSPLSAVVESVDYLLLEAESPWCDIYTHFIYYENY